MPSSPFTLKNVATGADLVMGEAKFVGPKESATISQRGAIGSVQHRRCFFPRGSRLTGKGRFRDQGITIRRPGKVTLAGAARFYWRQRRCRPLPTSGAFWEPVLYKGGRW